MLATISLPFSYMVAFCRQIQQYKEFERERRLVERQKKKEERAQKQAMKEKAEELSD